MRLVKCVNSQSCFSMMVQVRVCRSQFTLLWCLLSAMAHQKIVFFFFLYQLFLQGLDPVLVHSPLIGELLLGHLLRHLDSLHHLLHCLQMGLFNFCLQSEMQRKGFRGILTLIISLHEYTLPFRSNVFC